MSTEELEAKKKEAEALLDEYIAMFSAKRNGVELPDGIVRSLSINFAEAGVKPTARCTPSSVTILHFFHSVKAL